MHTNKKPQPVGSNAHSKMQKAVRTVQNAILKAEECEAYTNVPCMHAYDVHKLQYVTNKHFIYGILNISQIWVKI